MSVFNIKMKYKRYQFVIVLLILFLKTHYTVLNEASDEVTQEEEQDLKTKGVYSQIDHDAVFRIWKENLVDLKSFQMYTYIQSVEAIGHATVEQIKEWIQTNDGAKDLIPSLKKEALKEKLKETFPPCLSGVPDDFWDSILGFETTKTHEKLSDAINTRLDVWIEKWKKLMSQLPLTKTFKNYLRLPLVWELEAIEKLKYSTLIIQELRDGFSLVMTELGCTQTTEIDAAYMLQIFQRCKEKCSGMPDNVWEVLVIFPIEADQFTSLDNYSLNVDINISDLEMTMKPDEFHKGRMFSTWLDNKGDFESETGVNTQIGWANAAIQEIEQMPKKLEPEVKEDFITFDAMKLIVKNFIAYGGTRPFKIPRVFFLQVFYIKGMKNPIRRSEYLEEISRRLEFWKDRWTRYSKAAGDCQLVVEAHQPSEIYFLSKDEFIETINLLKVPHNQGECSSLFFLNQKGTTKRASKRVALKFFKDSTYANEIYLNHLIFEKLKQGKYANYRRYFVPILGRVNQFQSFKELRHFKYGLVFECSTVMTLRPFYKKFRPFSPMPSQMIQAIIYQILKAVNFIHSCGIIHLDLKPENILIEDNRLSSTQSTASLNPTELFEFYKKMITIKIIDFGNGRYLHSKYPAFEWPTNVSGSDHVTVWYRAPEIFLGADIIDRRVDIFSVGMLFYELTTRLPYLSPIWKEVDKKTESMLLYVLLPITTGEKFTDDFPLFETFGKKSLKHHQLYSQHHQSSLKEIEKKSLKAFYDIDGDLIRDFQQFWTKRGNKWAYPLLLSLLHLKSSSRLSSYKALSSSFFKEH